MPKSWARNCRAGALAVFLAHFIWVGLVIGQVRAEWLMGPIIVMSFITSNSAGLAAFLTALKAPEHGFLLGIALVPLAALMAVASNLSVRLAGVHIDLSGFRGILGLFAVTLAYGLFVAIIGAAIGWWARRRNAKDAQAATAAAPSEAPPG